MMPLSGSRRRSLLLAALLALMQACASHPDPAFSAGMSSRDLLEGSLFNIAAGEQPPSPRLLQVDAAMRKFLAARVPSDAAPLKKITLILRGVLEDGLRMDYDNLLTLSAADAFAARAGNCMSFTNLFIALARESGLRVSYQEVMLPPSWTDDDIIWIYNLHVNALVDLPGRTGQVVDFNLENYDNNYPRRLLSDNAAEARYHSNMGVHWMMRDDARQSFLHFRRAIELAPDTGHFWTNLGTLFRREGYIDRAEAALLTAVRRDAEAVAMSNLVKLYERHDRPELAAWFDGQVRAFRLKNPYYLFYSAQQALSAGDAATAKRQVTDAIRRHDGDRRFHDLLAMAELALGNTPAARRSLQQALALFDARQRESYQHKLQLLNEHRAM